MSKRGRDEEDTSRPPKRPKAESAPPAIEEINYARQLQQLLVFRQDGIQQLRNGIASFKAFLEAILYRKDEESRIRSLSILREYLDSQKPKDAGSETSTPFLPQLWQAWDFASQNNNDQLSSAVSAIFALLLRTLSAMLEFRDHGILLGRTVLQHRHLRLVKRGLEAPKTKEYVISPCLRLLTELVSFDGGALARAWYKSREQTFDIGSLRRNLGLYKAEISEEDAKRKPAIRTLTVRYVLAHLKYLHEGGKVDLLKSRPLCISLLHHLAYDPAELVNEILNVTEQHVLKDDDLPRSVKATLLTQHNLERITEIASRSGENHGASERALAWLKAVATTPSYGILRESGWYPAGTTKLPPNMREKRSAIDLGLDSLDFYDSGDRPDIRNSVLLDWLLTLRPHSSTSERSVLLAAFKSAPELVAAYFTGKTMQLEPKLSNTWIGYASLLFEVIDLPVPSHLGATDQDHESEHVRTYADLPPQTNIVLESVMPRPVTKKVLTRCLNQGPELITFFALCILVLSLRKLGVITEQMRQALLVVSDDHRVYWEQAIERLLSSFTQRAPAMKDVIAAFRKLPDDEEHALQREAATRLLRLYLEVTPIQALEESFDISVALTAALSRDRGTAGDEIKALRDLELEHLLVIAQSGTGMKWLTKQGGLPSSPLASLIQVHLRDLQNWQVRSLLANVMSEDSLVAGAGSEELDALLASLASTAEIDDEVWSFIDDCLSRATRQPVKYIDLLDNVLATDGPDEGAVGLFVAAVLEQASFVRVKTVVVDWIVKYTDLLCCVSKRRQTFKTIRKAILSACGRPGHKEKKEISSELLEEVRLPELAQHELQASGNSKATENKLPFDPLPLQKQSDDRPELLRWYRKDLTVAVEDGDVDALMLCLCSTREDVRSQARAQLQLLFMKLKTPGQEEHGQQSILIGSLIETYERQGLQKEKALPYLAGTFAARALAVLNEPTHFLYPKVNKYLMKSPEWRITQMASYWLDNTLQAEPTEDDAHWREVSWVLEWLVDGLRTPADLDLLRKQEVFEQVMAAYMSPGDARMKGLRQTILELLFRASSMEGGYDVLLKRTGVLADLVMLRRSGEDVPGLLRERILKGCDADTLQTWSAVEAVM